MEPDEIVLVIASEAEKGRLRGKTLLQKRAYFVSKILGIELGYRAHYYGPYSPRIDQGLAKSKALGFLEERTLGFGIADPAGFEMRRYDYQLTEDGRAIVTFLSETDPEEFQNIKACLQRMVEAGDHGDQESLSIAAKTHHILSENTSAMNVDEIRIAAGHLGWNIPADRIERAIEFLERLELIPD